MKIGKVKKVDRDAFDDKNCKINEGRMKGAVFSISHEEGSSSCACWRIVRQDHEEAVRNFEVESYLLDEMSEEDQIYFEQHCLECIACTKAVEAGRIFISNVAPPPAFTPWFGKIFNIIPSAPWLKPAAVTAALWLPVFGWQQFTIADLMGAHPNTVILARGLEKGAAENTYPLRTPSATIEFCIPPRSEFSFYRVKIAGGQSKSFSQIVPAPANDSDRRLSVQVLRKKLGSGHFSVLVDGLDAEDSRDGHKLDEVYEFDLK
jgi:hypothetical protein